MKIKKVLVGLEIHVELKTKSKMFCGCANDSDNNKPNSLTCPACLGLPGALPVPNKEAINKTILIGLALNCHIPQKSKFDRKNYFYPDLPKGYQITQYDQPFAINGWLNLKIQSFDKLRIDLFEPERLLPQSRRPERSRMGQNSKLKISIRRVHLEEDTGKSIHTEVCGEKVTLLDFNKSGIPLVEIVSDPQMESAEEVIAYCQKIRKIIQYLGVSDCDLEKGQMRFEPTINLLIEDQGKEFYTPLVEIKNINSFRFLKRAIEFEIERQYQTFQETKEEKSSGNKTTRGFDQVKMVTFEQRHKEEAEEYRYFPEPDIPPFRISEKEISNLKSQISRIELPEAIEKIFIEKYGLNDAQIEVLTEEKSLAKFYEDCVGLGGDEGISSQEIANIIINKRIDYQNLSPIEFIKKIGESKNKFVLDDKDISVFIDEVIKENLKVVEDYLKGKTQVLGFLIGQVQKKALGKADPKIVQKILLEKLPH